MSKLIVIILSVLLFACHKNETEKKQTNRGIADSSKYDIETITYWGDGEKQTTLFGYVRVDTINHIGAGVRYTEAGRMFERIVILDAKNAIKLVYDNDSITSSTMCKYRVLRNHKVQKRYSIVAKKSSSTSLK